MTERVRRFARIRAGDHPAAASVLAHRRMGAAQSLVRRGTAARAAASRGSGAGIATGRRAHANGPAAVAKTLKSIRMPPLLDGSDTPGEHNRPHIPRFIAGVRNAKSRPSQRSSQAFHNSSRIYSACAKHLDRLRRPGIVRHHVITRFETMTSGGKLRAWIERRAGGNVLAGFVGVIVAPDGRTTGSPIAPPLPMICRSAEEARAWSQEEAAAFGLAHRVGGRGPPVSQ